MQMVIEIADEYVNDLKIMAQKQHTDENYLIEQAVEAWLKHKSQPVHPMREAFGLFKNNPEIIDGVEYQNRLRAEWD